MKWRTLSSGILSFVPLSVSVLLPLWRPAAAAAASFASSFIARVPPPPPTTRRRRRRRVAAVAFAGGRRQSPVLATTTTMTTTATTALGMGVQTRGLEVRREGATPKEGGMTLYLKAGPDQTSVGDCPFAQFVRMVLEEKGLEYDLKPSVPETKPKWLVEHYDGKMPALRHNKECYVESDVIAEYLDFFFQDPPLKLKQRSATEAAEQAIDGFFPAVAKYLKHTPDGDEEDAELKANVEGVLSKLEAHLQQTGPYLVGDSLTLLDCSLAPKLYHLHCGLEAFKDNAINLPEQFPAVQAYMDAVFGRASFQKTVYPKETVAWGWGNARK